jgi:UDP-N-acetyl-2-amino-2-deoxyglucuronate dehydrogenase
MHGPIRFVIVGCGHIAQRHALQATRTGILTGVCDVKNEKASVLAQQYSTHCYTDADKMLAEEKEIDVAVICTPNGLHAEHTIKALASGCHVLCEKPMAISTSTATTMIAAAEKYQRLLFIVKQNRFNPPVQALKKLLEEGRLGRVFSFQLSCFWNRNKDYYQDWRGTANMDGGTLFTQFSHFIDLIYWLLGDVKTIEARMSNCNHQGAIDFEDTGTVLLEMQNGSIGTINYTVNSYQKNMEGSLTVFAEKGTVKIGGQYLNELSYQQIENYQLPVLPAGNKPNQYGNYEGSMSNHDKVYDNLAAVLQNKESISVSAYDGLKTVEIIERIYKAAIYL